MSNIEVTITVNGTKHRLTVGPKERLLDTLRERLHLTGTKEGCGVGECGACTVILDGEAVHSCMVLTAQVDGSEVLTVEGLEVDGRLHPLQEAFIKHHAVQCGFCTPGMLMSAKALLDKNPNPTREEIKTAIEGNLCRCTGYEQIIEAIESVAKEPHINR
ncbi:aerobic-type carbon monoxide dehydrogenase, small subunit CoxS/CutS-like protein [Acetomicrobium mobile DSM 13181]|uniref:Aerobic-type carbon monoxide dehydrogenase, small subunit CoxS/CutS-like protein n=1 Tax=Acetomicrobium mobile (strain ATCC BAA-54 / DSM 13181 / JCM 12221 / NGA) TaxID=891968 RepID=I4BXF7_ACEMN|nr:(2Fe-2S)-binding protein [Acetomicrobium mobile]AFM21964.1 aerobic-type carbon monoxide dehydrogenase, small subunit CoxS/CutS-like protein [Acetomicrobium mobile DSM 13181]